MTPETLFPVAPAPPHIIPVRAHMRALTPRDLTPTARTTDPETSHEAARQVAVRAGSHRHRALAALYAYGGLTGLTDFELAAHTNLAQTSIGKRRLELVRLGLVEKVEGLTRPSPSGASSQVWRITPFGITKAYELREA